MSKSKKDAVGGHVRQWLKVGQFDTVSGKEGRKFVKRGYVRQLRRQHAKIVKEALASYEGELQDRADLEWQIQADLDDAYATEQDMPTSWDTEWDTDHDDDDRQDYVHDNHYYDGCDDYCDPYDPMYLVESPSRPVKMTWDALREYLKDEVGSSACTPIRLVNVAAAVGVTIRSTSDPDFPVEMSPIQ